MSGLETPPAVHSGASTSTASASQEPPPLVEDQQNNSRKRPRENDYPGLWDLDSISEDALQGLTDLQHLSQPLQQACKRRRLVSELQSFEKFIYNFIKWRRFKASKGNNNNNNAPAEGNATEFLGAVSLQELESLPIVEDLETPSPQQGLQDRPQEAAATEGEVIQSPPAPDQVRHGHQASPSSDQVRNENQPCPPTEAHVLHSHHGPLVQQRGIQHLQPSPAHEQVTQSQQESPAEMIQGQQMSPAEVIQVQQESPDNIQMAQGQHMSPAETTQGQRVSPVQMIQGQQVSPANIQMFHGQRMSPAEVIHGQQVFPSSVQMIHGQQVSPAEVIQGHQMSSGEGPMIYGHRVSPLSGDQIFRDSSAGSHVRCSHPVLPAPVHVFPGQRVSPVADQVVPGQQVPRLAGRGIQNVSYSDQQILHRQMPLAAADPALMNYPAHPAHQEQSFFVHNSSGPANVFHRHHWAPHDLQVAAAPRSQQQQQQDASRRLSQDHFPRPIRSESRGRARTLGCLRHSRLRLGLKRTSMMCQVCKVPLCVDCFYPFHVEMV